MLRCVTFSRMATEGTSRPLTRRQIVRLGATISADNMESIAEGYMDIDDVTIKNIRRDASNSEAFNRDVIRHWANKHPENQVQVCKLVTCRACKPQMWH